MNRDLDEKLNNSYVIKRHLATLRKLPGDRCYQFNIGDFQIRLFTNAEYSDPPNKELARVTLYDKISFELWEKVDPYVVDGPGTFSMVSAGGARQKIELSTDYRFANYYKDIRYTNVDWHWENGKLMPLSIACDLIKFINRINELTAFH